MLTYLLLHGDGFLPEQPLRHVVQRPEGAPEGDVPIGLLLLVVVHVCKDQCSPDAPSKAQVLSQLLFVDSFFDELPPSWLHIF